MTEASGDGGALKIERKGVSLYELGSRVAQRTPGLEPEKGVNATLELAHQALAVAALGDAALGTTVTPTVVRAGTRPTRPRRRPSWSTCAFAASPSRIASTPRCMRSAGARRRTRRG